MGLVRLVGKAKILELVIDSGYNAPFYTQNPIVKSFVWLTRTLLKRGSIK